MVLCVLLFINNTLNTLKWSKAAPKKHLIYRLYRPKNKTTDWRIISPEGLIDIGASSNQTRLSGHVAVKVRGQEQAVVVGCWAPWCGFLPGNTNTRTHVDVCQCMEIKSTSYNQYKKWFLLFWFDSKPSKRTFEHNLWCWSKWENCRMFFGNYSLIVVQPDQVFMCSGESPSHSLSGLSTPTMKHRPIFDQRLLQAVILDL